MISATRRWLRRNRTSFAIGAGALALAYVAGQYVVSKISDARERLTADRIAKENLRRRFQQNQEDCTFTVLALLPTATDDILEALSVEDITRDLQQKKAERLGRSEGRTSDPSSAASGPPSVTDDDGRSLSSFQSGSYVRASQIGTTSSATSEGPSKSKAQLWNELKIGSATRAFTLVYVLSLLTLLTRIQLNLLGRRNYLSSVVSLVSYHPHVPTITLENRDDDNAEQSYGNDFETNRKFLTFSWWLLHRGWREIMAKVEAAVQDVFGPLSPRQDIQLDQLSALVLDVRRKVEGDAPEDRKNQRWLCYLLPPPDQEDMVLRESAMTSSPSSSPPPHPTNSTSPIYPTASPSQLETPAAATSASAPPLRRLLDETSDLIESPPFTQILTLLLDTAFSRLTDHHLRSEAFKISPVKPISSLSESRMTEITPENDPARATTKLATILAVLTRQAHAIGHGLPNEYAQAMEGVPEMEAFAALIFTEGFELDAPWPDSGDPPDRSKAWDLPTETVAQGKETVGGAEARPIEGMVSKTWAGFEGIWGRVVGKNRDMRAPGIDE
ncbi:MAG: hypothetical protein Q9191_002233 [Dirinaria sp. TL-2023a]